MVGLGPSWETHPGTQPGHASPPLPPPPPPPRRALLAAAGRLQAAGVRAGGAGRVLQVLVKPGDARPGCGVLWGARGRGQKRPRRKHPCQEGNWGREATR